MDVQVFINGFRKLLPAFHKEIRRGNSPKITDLLQKTSEKWEWARDADVAFQEAQARVYRGTNLATLRS